MVWWRNPGVGGHLRVDIDSGENSAYICPRFTNPLTRSPSVYINLPIDCWGIRVRHLYYILQYSPLLPVSYGLLKMEKLSLPLRLLVVWQMFSLGFTIVMTFLSLAGKNNLWLMNIATPVYTVLVMSMFAAWMPAGRLRKGILFLGILIIFSWVIEIFLFGSLFRFSIVSRPFMNVAIVTVGCISVYDDNRNDESLLVDQPRFWISSGLIIYYSGTLVVNILSDMLLRISEEALRNALLIQSGLSLVSSLLYTNGLRISWRR